MNDSLEPPRMGRRRAPRALLRRPRALAAVGVLVLVAAVAVVLLVVFPPLGGDSARSPGADERPGADGTDGVGAPSGQESTGVGDLTGVSRPAAVALQTWARPDLAYGEWWRALSPLLTPGARNDYALTDPANLPEIELDLEAKVDARRGPSRDTATVFFSTSGGRFGVDMSRRGADEAWLMVRIVFPGQKSGLS